MFKKAVGYISDTGFLGNIDVINHKNETVTLSNESDEVGCTVGFKEVEIMDELFTIFGYSVYEKDVLKLNNDGNLFIVKQTNQSQISLTLLDSKTLMEADEKSFVRLDNDGLKFLEKHFTLEGNFYYLKSNLPKIPEFNIEIVKRFEKGVYTYYYACNDKGQEVIDLIKVIFVGSMLIEEEDYERVTLNYEQYINKIENGYYTKVTPSELQNYALGATYKEDKKEEEETEIFDDSDSKLNVSDILTAIYGKSKGNTITAWTDNDNTDKNDGQTNGSKPLPNCNKCYGNKTECDCNLWD